jgi:hypothetical protein
MSDIFKVVSKLKDLFKAIKEQQSLLPKIKPIGSIKPPPAPSLTASNKATKIPGMGPDSKKDPKNVAQQIKDGSMSTKTQKIMLKSDGQWADSDIEKADEEAGKKLYHIHQEGHQITDKPLSLEEINTRHGGAQKLENAGFRLIPHKIEPTEKAEKKTNPKDPILNDGKFAPKPLSPEKLKEQSLKLESYKKNKEKLK